MLDGGEKDTPTLGGNSVPCAELPPSAAPAPQLAAAPGGSFASGVPPPPQVLGPRVLPDAPLTFIP